MWLKVFFKVNNLLMKNTTIFAASKKHRVKPVSRSFEVPARVAELVDALVSKTNGFYPCRFDSGLGYLI
jgi:hypothetical protein